MSAPLHPASWAAWVGAVMAWLLVARNPLYLALVLLIVALVRAAIPPAPDAPATLLDPWRFALLVVPLSALFNALNTHIGATVLATLPAWLPLLGGPLTLEALLFGALNGLVLTGVFATFATLQSVLSVRALVRLVPRAFHPVAVVVAVALTFVPATLRQMSQIREAQAVRGHRLRGLRDWGPLFLPLLVGGLERALQLAEAMTARGFAAHDAPIPVRARLWLVIGLALVLAGWLLVLGWGAMLGYGLLAAGVGAVGVTLWQAGRGSRHRPYRPDPWRARDGATLAALLIALAPLLIARDALAYYPYPRVAVPTFTPWVALFALALLAPALAAPTRARPAAPLHEANDAPH